MSLFSVSEEKATLPVAGKVNDTDHDYTTQWETRGPGCSLTHKTQPLQIRKDTQKKAVREIQSYHSKRENVTECMRHKCGICVLL